MKKKSALLALLMSIAIFASMATGCSKDIENSVSETTTTTTAEETTTEATTTTEAATTTEATTTTAATTTTKPAATTKKAAAATTKAAATTAKPATAAATTAAPAVNTSGLGKYVYNTLTAEEKTVYDEIVAAIIARKDTVTFSSAHDGAMVTKIYQTVFFQESTLFWFMADTSQWSGSTTSIPLHYRYNAADQATMQKNLDGAVARITAKFPANASATVKMKVIHDDIISRTGFSWDENARSAYGPLVLGQGQCEGYAKAISYVCTKVGIDSVRITGTDKKGSTHAWNKVLIDGKWYNVDTTWDDPTGHNANYYKNWYLLVPDSQINNITHFPVTTFAPPVANSLDANYFVKYGLCANTAEQALTMMQNQMISSAKAKLEVCEVKCSSRAVYDQIKNTVIGNAIAMQTKTNATAGVNAIKSLADGSDPNTWVIQINLTF